MLVDRRMMKVYYTIVFLHLMHLLQDADVPFDVIVIYIDKSLNLNVVTVLYRHIYSNTTRHTVDLPAKSKLKTEI